MSDHDIDLRRRVAGTLPVLNLGNKHRIRVAVLNHRFGKRRDELHARDVALALQVYNDVYGEDWKSIADRLNPVFLENQTELRVAFGGRIVRLYAPVGWVGLRAPTVKKYPADHKFSVEHARIFADREQLNQEEKDAGAKVDAALNKARTTKQLLDQWPELEPFVRQVCGQEEKKSDALAIPRDDLNKLLDLPVK